MKTKTQVAVEDSEDNETASTGMNETANVQLTEEDKEKGNLKKFNISKKTIKKLKARNVEILFPVQAKSYTSIYEQTDCLIQASNGIGKTLAFALPLVELLQSDKSVELSSGRAPRVLVIAPTRDITKQISDDFQSIANDLTVVPIFSAKKKSDEQETAVANGCDVLVATPDRLKEFLDNEKVDLSEVKHVVLDEVDRMLEAAAVEDLKKILKQVFTSDGETKAQLIVFSATSPDALRKLTKKYLSADVVTINLAGKNTQGASSTDDEGFDETANGSSAKASSKAEEGSRSLLSKQENYTTYQLSTNEEIKSVGFVYTILRKCFGDDFDAKSSVAQVAFTKDYTTAVFDLPSELDEKLQSTWKNNARTQLVPATELPELDESSITDNKGFSRGGGGGAGGNRNAGRSSNGCFKCGKDGHKSFECPDASGSQRNGGNRSGGGGGGGGNGCFNCGKEGHRSYECTEPKKAGGGGGGRSGGGNACFNCGQEGHRSYECTEPKKAGGGGGGARSGGGNACFNCGQEGHRSYECTEPKKAGGGGGGARSGGGNACFNCGQEGHRSYECTEPKKAGGGGGGGGGGGQSGGCFNCGKDGHKSFECSEPKKGRPSFGGGGGGRGGGRGGSRDGGAKRSFGGSYENGHSAGEATNKKIKFDDDD